MYCALAMANRRLALDSGQRCAETTIIHQHFHFKKLTYLTTYLVLIIFLASAHSASFNQPRYDLIFSKLSDESKSNFDGLNRKPHMRPLLASDNLSHYYDTPASKSETATDLLANNFQDQRERYLRRLAAPIKKSSSSSPLDSSYPLNLIFDWPDEKQQQQQQQQQKLDDYMIKSERVSSPSYDAIYDIGDSGVRDDESQYEQQSNINPTANLFYLADQLAKEQQQLQQSQPIVNYGTIKDIYQLDDEYGSDSAESEIGKESSLGELKDNHNRNFTTLLDDADETLSKDSATTTTTITTTTEPPTSSAEVNETVTTPAPIPVVVYHTTPSYGHVITSQNLANKQSANSWTEKLGRIYTTLTSYLPSFSWFYPASSKNNQSEPVIRFVKIDDDDEDDISSGKKLQHKRLIAEHYITKPSVSDAKFVAEPSGDNQVSASRRDEMDNNLLKARDMKKNDKLMASNTKKLGDLQDSVDYNNGLQIGVETNGVKVNIYRDEDDLARQTSNKHRSHILNRYADYADSRDLLPDDRDNKVSLLRESTISMPYKANDEFLVKETGKNPESLLGRYIYAPEHHYHLSTVMQENPRKPGATTTTLVMGASDDQPSQRSSMRHMRPEDDNGIFGGPFSGLRPMYTSADRLDGSGLGGNKNNDLYFLVMVGAFCVMAMAVVLSAGLFAYRVQQNRKSTAETDYPTYGVVGPNNMNGKCGAAAFMGGYFGAPNDRPATSSSSPIGGKSACGSVKRLPDGSFSDGTTSTASANRMMTSKRHNNSANELANQGGKAPNFMVPNQNAARMYHYQHQKQQMIISDHASAGRHTSASDLDSEDENDEGYTVYECPGLASAHEMEIKNPLFNDDQSP